MFSADEQKKYFELFWANLNDLKRLKFEFRLKVMRVT